MKHLSLLAAAALGLALTACSSDETLPDGIATNGDGNVELTVSAPEALASRAAALGTQSSSALGGITNCDMTKYDFRYQLAIYDAAGTTQYISTDLRTEDTYSEETYRFRLTPGHEYKFVVWADFVNQGSEADLHYCTHTAGKSDLTKITCLDDKDHQLNDESRDAYFITRNLCVKGDGTLYDPADTKQTPVTELILRRPFAKVRVVTTDWKHENLPMPDKFKITYQNCTRFNGMNAVTGLAGDEHNIADDYTDTVFVSPTFASKDTKDYALSYDTEDHNRTLTVDYLMVNSEENDIHMRFQAYDSKNSDALIIDKKIETSIPTKRNWLTTLLGNFLTAGTQIKVSCREAFYDEWIRTDPWWAPTEFEPAVPQVKDGWYLISNENEFVWMSMTSKTDANDMSGKKAKLLNDIDLNNVPFVPIAAPGGNFEFDGQGHTLRNIHVDFTKVEKYAWIFERAVEGAGVFGNLYVGSYVHDVNFKDITINGLYSSTGHEDEVSRSAGCIGRMGGNVENCHAENVTVNGKPGLMYNNNVGGLIGYYDIRVYGAHVSNCSVKHVLIHADAQAGGVIGTIGCDNPNDNTTTDMTVRNCTADGVWIHNSKENIVNISAGKTVTSGGLAAIVGNTYVGNGLVLDNCSTTADFNVYGPDAIQNKKYMDAMQATDAYDYQKAFLLGLSCFSADKVVVK